MPTEDQKDKPDRVDPVSPGNLEIFREYLKVRERLDAAEAIINERFTFRAEAEANMKASQAIEGVLKSVLDTQKARIGDLTKEIEKYSNQVESHLRQMPDFMIVSVTHAGNLQVCGECPTPADLHRHSGFYYDHVHIKEVALYAKIHFPFEDDDTMAVVSPQPLKFETIVDLSGKAGEGNTMSEEKPEEKPEEKKDEKETEDGIQIEIEELTLDPSVPYLSDYWEKHLDKYRDVLELCYDRALSVCVMPEIAGKMALAMYASIVSSPNAAYREFLDAMQVYMERIAPEPREPMETIPFLSQLSGALSGLGFGIAPVSPDFQMRSEPSEHPGEAYNKYVIVCEYGQGEHRATFYHELAEPPGLGKEQAIKFYRDCVSSPSVRRAYLCENISDQVPAQGEPVAQERKPDQDPDQEKEIKPPAEKPDGENK